MKCIKVVKETKDNKLGTIRRVADSEADTKVSSKVWAFCPKSEWKLATRKPVKTETIIEQTTEVVDLSIEEKRLARKKKNK